MGEFIEGDSLSNTGIFRVSEYLLGRGGEHLLVSLNDTSFVLTYLLGRYLGGGCIFPNSPFQIGSRYLIFMERQLDGHYIAMNQGVFLFDDLTATFRLSFELEHQRTFTFSTLRSFVLDYHDVQSAQPHPNRPIPLTAPILLTSQRNRNYLVPVDGSALIHLTSRQVEAYRRAPHCEYVGCIAFSPNGLDRVPLTDVPNPFYPHPFYGRALHISPNSQLVAVRRDDELVIGTLGYPQVGQEMWSTTIKSFALTPMNSLEATNFRMVWSPDSRWLAFSDGRGLWIWDVIAIRREPQLLISYV
jgi:hypothetical protein